MNYSQTLTVLLDNEAHRFAEQFAAEQATLLKGRQVYLNTLAVCAVHRYLKWLSINTKLDGGDCWHPGLRAIFNVADLTVPNIGKLECRPLLPDEDAFVLPPEVRDSRIGYIIVQLSESLQAGKLLGFLEANAIGKDLDPISISQLQTLDSLINSIHWWRRCVRLNQWFQGIFEQEWQPLSLLLEDSGGSFRSAINRTTHHRDSPTKSISRGKIISWGTEQDIILVVQIVEKSLEEVELRLIFFPGRDEHYLPSGLQVMVLDEFECPCLEARAKNDDNWIELALSGQPQDQFTLQITLGKIMVTEQFII